MGVGIEKLSSFSKQGTCEGGQGREHPMFRMLWGQAYCVFQHAKSTRKGAEAMPKGGTGFTEESTANLSTCLIDWLVFVVE